MGGKELEKSKAARKGKTGRSDADVPRESRRPRELGVCGSGLGRDRRGKKVCSWKRGRSAREAFPQGTLLSLQSLEDQGGSLGKRFLAHLQTRLLPVRASPELWTPLPSLKALPAQSITEKDLKAL